MSERSGPLPEEFKISRQTGDIIEELQMKIAQRTGEVPHFPFAMGADEILHELVEEDVRDYPEESQGDK